MQSYRDGRQVFELNSEILFFNAENVYTFLFLLSVVWVAEPDQHIFQDSDLCWLCAVWRLLLCALQGGGWYWPPFLLRDPQPGTSTLDQIQSPENKYSRLLHGTWGHYMVPEVIKHLVYDERDVKIYRQWMSLISITKIITLQINFPVLWISIS